MGGSTSSRAELRIVVAVENCIEARAQTGTENWDGGLEEKSRAGVHFHRCCPAVLYWAGLDQTSSKWPELPCQQHKTVDLIGEHMYCRYCAYIHYLPA